MKVSGSVPCSLIAAAYLAVHLAFLPPSLEDIDSINFALGLRDFDIGQHQPHPPGYPVYIALGRASLGVLNAAASSLDQVHAEALALSIWSALGGAMALAAAWRMFRAIELDVAGRAEVSRVPLLAVALLAVAPLFWMSGLRPMSDMPGLAAALVAQALLLGSWRRPSLLAPAAFAAAFAVGVRAQAVWLTAPLLAAVAFRHRGAGAWWLASRPVAAGIAGVLVWAVPLLIASGGPGPYLTALGSQAGEDFAWVEMLWANPTPRRLAFAIYDTFVMPWGSVSLAVVVWTAIAGGLVVAVARMPRALGLMAVAFAPYAVFHLLMQETLHVRYALPVLPPLAWLAAGGIAALGRGTPVAAAVVVLFAAGTAVPGMLAYSREPHPAFRAIADMDAAARRERPARIFAHYAVRRPLQARTPRGVTFVEPPRTSEWMTLVEYWRSGGTAPVWFLADPRRTDLAIVDPESRLDVGEYRWLAAVRPELSGMRPAGVDWYRLRAPGWFAGAGWSLTPELGGVTRLEGSGVDRRPIEAMVRRRPEAMIAIVGARHLGSAGDAPLSFHLAIDGRVVDTWTLDPSTSLNALRVVELPAGSLSGSGPYASLTIAAQASDAETPTPAVAIRQFDIQPTTGLLYAFDEGWHEEEYDNATGLRWRWSSGRSVLRVLPPQPVRLRLKAESPLRYFDAPPRVRITAGDRVVAELRPDRDFDWSGTISNEDVRRAGGLIAVETDPVYLPGRAEGTADERALGLRLFEIDVSPVLP